VDDQGRKEMVDKLVMHCRGSKEREIRYNRYVVNGKLFRTQTRDAGKRTQNSDACVCVPTVDGKMYNGKLTKIIEVEYYERTKYVLFKCDWTDTRRDIGYKVNENGLVLVNFKKLVHTVKLITNKPYMLTTQVVQVFYVEDEQDPGWACAISNKPRNVYDIGHGEGYDDACAIYHECEPLLLTSNNDHDP
jgi:hypothetical protein